MNALPTDCGDGLSCDERVAPNKTSTNGSDLMATMTSDSRSSSGSLSISGEGSRSVRRRYWCHFPIWLTMSLILLATVVIGVMTISVVTASLIGADVERLISEYSKEASFRIGQRVNRSFAVAEQVTTLTINSVNAAEGTSQIVSGMTAGVHSTRFRASISFIVNWFAVDMLANNLQLVLVNNNDIGMVVGAYAQFDPTNFPRREGWIVIQFVDAAASAIWVRYVAVVNPSASLQEDNFTGTRSVASTDASFDVVGGWYVLSNQSFNFSSRPYAYPLRHGMTWCAPYVGSLPTTSSIAVGGPITSRSLSQSLFASPNPAIPFAEEVGTASYRFYALDLKLELEALPLTPSSKILLVDAATWTFLGGNIASNSTRLAANGSYVVTKLTDLESEISVGAVLKRFDRTIMSASCATGCLWSTAAPHFDSLHAGTRAMSRDISVFFDDALLIYAVSIRMPAIPNLDLRLIVMVPASDVTNVFRTAVIESWYISGLCCLGLLVAVIAPLYWLLAPLRYSSKLLAEVRHQLRHTRDPAPFLQAFTSSGRQRGLGCRPRYLTIPCSERVLRLHVELNEVTVISEAMDRFMRELLVLAAFFPSIAFLGAADEGAESPHDLNGSQRLISTTAGISFSSDSNSRSCRIQTRGTAAPDHVPSEWIVRAAQPPAIHGEVAAAPYTRGGRWSSLITYVVCDAGLLRAATADGRMQPKQVDDAYRTILNEIKSQCDAFGGCIHHLYGDAIYLHFNAERRTKSHAVAASRATSIVQTRLAAKSLPVVRFGIASGASLCGTFGPPSLRGFHVFGGCVLEAVALARYTSADFPTLMGPSASRLLSSSTTHLAYHVAIAHLPNYELSVPISVPICIDDIRTSWAQRSPTQTFDSINKETIVNACARNNATFEASAAAPGASLS